jgi:hypothetical protein
MRKTLLVLLVGCCSCVVYSTDDGSPENVTPVVLVDVDAGADANECVAEAEPANVDQDAQAMQSPCFVP